MVSSAEFREREVKYRALPDSLIKFTHLCVKRRGRMVLGAGADTYWVNPELPALPPLRHRYNQEYGELTCKQQVTNGCNITRKEVNIQLTGAQIREMEEMLPMMGYQQALTITKVAHICYLPYVVLSWYPVLSMDGTPMLMEDGLPASFVEVELDERQDWRILAEEVDLRRGLDLFPGPVPGAALLLEPMETEQFCQLVLGSWVAFLGAEQIIDPAKGRVELSLWELFGKRGAK